MLEHLDRLKGQFGRDAARRTAALLERLEKARLRDPADLIHLHETALYLRAYPQSARVLRLADRILFSFGDRLGRIAKLDKAPFEDPEISGIAGTALSTNFSYEIAKSVVQRHGKALQIDWDNFSGAHRLGRELARLIPLAHEDWSVEPHPDWKRWWESLRLTPAWLLERVSPETYDFLEIPLRWEFGDGSATRSRARIPTREIFYHRGPLLRRSDVSLEIEFAGPKIPVTRLSRQKAAKILDVIVDTSAARYRELWGFTHPDLTHVDHADFGRGVEVFFFGVPDQWRLPVRAYHAGMFFKNGVPIGYVEGLSLFEHMEVGFNLYYTFREGETAWLYARMLKLFRERFGVTSYSVDPYQLGHDNQEAIAAGAFWFYRKLGFRPTSQEVDRLVALEEKKIATRREYRTPPAILRRLAAVPLIYGGGPEWDRFDARKLAQRLASAGKSPWSENREVEHAKHAPEETRFLRAMQKDAKLRRTMLRLGSG